MVQTFPNVSADDLWNKVSNLQERSKWDERWTKSEFLGDHNGGEAIYIQMPKPPVPLVSAREMVLTFWKVEDYGEGKRAQIAQSTTKDGAPLNSSNQLAQAKLFAAIVEADGSGSKMTEVRCIDMCGNLMGAIVDKASKNMPVRNFEAWNKAFA